MTNQHETQWAQGSRPAFVALVALVAGLPIACAPPVAPNEVRASGYVEATEIRVAAEVGGRLLSLGVEEGDRIELGDVLARLDTADTELSLQRARAERQQSDAQLRLLQAGARPEDVRQAESQVEAATARLDGARVELTAAERDLERFESLLESSSGSRKQRDDAVTRRDVAAAQVAASTEMLQGAREGLASLRSGARSQEIDAARARLAVAEAQIATLEKRQADATLVAPASGIVTERLANAGELLAPGSPLLVITDMDRAWANLFLDEPVVPRLRLGQDATVHTDAGGAGVAGRVTFISSRAEFTPRNVQTAEERSKLVYRIKVTVDNREGILKQGMPVEAVIPLSALDPPGTTEAPR